MRGQQGRGGREGGGTERGWDIGAGVGLNIFCRGESLTESCDARDFNEDFTG